MMRAGGRGIWPLAGRALSAPQLRCLSSKLSDESEAALLSALSAVEDEDEDPIYGSVVELSPCRTLATVTGLTEATIGDVCRFEDVGGAWLAGVAG